MYRKSYGFTLVELIVVLAILGIIVAIVVSRLTVFKSMAEENICAANMRTVERLYSVFLFENDHGDSIFNQFLIENFDEVCPASGVISYADGEVRCSLHKDRSENGEEDSSGDEVPWI